MRFQSSGGSSLRVHQLLLSGSVVIGFPSVVQAESIHAETDPKQILDGIEVPTCGWPSVVALHSEPPMERCTGVYVGGNVILTVAHCIPRGWRVPLDVICDEPSDCPAVGEYDDILSLDCDPGVAFGCIADDMALSNRILYAQFGERYYSHYDSGTGTTGSIRNAVPIRYCRRINDVQVDDLSEADDFAYCVLAEAPNIQPTPLMMHCEADLYLTEGSTVTAVGFGQAMSDMDPMTDFGGVKRQAVGTLDETLDSASNQLSGSMFADDWQVAGGPGPDPQSHGDSGGPLFLEMPDGTVRVIGLAREELAQYNTVWPYAAWIASDPHVDLDGLLPCHDTDGTWQPSSECGEFVRNSEAGKGSWGRGEAACHHTDLAAPSETCGDNPMGLHYSPPRTPDGLQHSTAADSGSESSPASESSGSRSLAEDEQQSGGCSLTVTTSDSPRTIGFLLSLIGLGFRSSRRRSNEPHWRNRVLVRASGVIGLALLLCACPADNPGSGADSTTGPGCEDDPLPSSPPGNPDFTAVVGGIALGGTSYEALAVGNIAKTATSTSCCQDYALVSSTSKEARVILSAPHDGLTFASTTKDQLVTFAATGGGLDVALARHDSDNRNDLWVLRTDKRLARVTAVAAPVGAIYFPASSYSDWPTNNAGTTAKSQMAVGDLDCDGDVDAAFPATNNRVLVVLNNQTSFAAPFALNSGHDPVRVALADVDNNGSLDILSAGRTGKLSVITSVCGGVFDDATTYQFLGIGGNYPDARLAAGRFCPGHPNDIAVAIGALEYVEVACGDGTGSFDDVVEPHGDTVSAPFVYDYSWNFTGRTVKELAFWSESGGDLVGLFSGSDSFKLLEPASCQIESRALPLLRSGSLVSTFELHSESLGGTSWTRIAAAGPLGLVVSH